jgi:YVTN family beta-propeller protein
MQVTTITSGRITGGINGGPSICTTTQNTSGGVPLPLVTLLNQNALAIGSATNTVAVGINPTVVIPFHNNPVTTTIGAGICSKIVTSYSGAQSALVVNTGSNSVTVAPVGTYPYPSGTVTVGRQPVAATINSAQTMAYVANYADGTISEVNLSTLQQTRTIPVMSHPASVTFDTNGNLWVGGQGAVMNVDVIHWLVASSEPVNGTINGMSYDQSTGLLVQTMLQNGSVAAPTYAATSGGLIAFSATPQTSYSTQTTYQVASGITTTSTFLGDNAAYSQSSIAPYLAFPGQTAFGPPIYTNNRRYRCDCEWNFVHRVHSADKPSAYPGDITTPGT